MTSRSRDVSAADVKPPRLSQEEVNRLLDKRLIAKLATVDERGRVHIVPMWFRRDGDRILIPTSRHTRKIRNLRHRPQASVMIDQSRSGLDLKGVLIRGDVELLEGPQALELNRSIHLRYVTERGLSRPSVSHYLLGDDVTVRIAMNDVITWDMTAGSAGRELAGTDDVYELDA